MSSQIVPLKQKMKSFHDLMRVQAPEIKKAVPKGVDPQRMVRAMLTILARNPKLLDCTPQSVMGALMQAANYGLELDPFMAQAYLVPYKTTCQLIVGYQGLVALAMRTPDVKSVVARAVYKEDVFQYELGINERLVHKPMLDQERTASTLTHVYAVAKLVDGEGMVLVFEVMSKAEVDKVRARSRSRDDGPWVTDYEMMARKTVVRRLSKWLPKSTEFMQAVAHEERIESGQPNDGIDQLVDELMQEPAIEGKAEKALPGGQGQEAQKTKLDAYVEEQKGKEAAQPQTAPQPAQEAEKATRSREPGDDDDDPRPVYDPRPDNPQGATAREESAAAQQARHEPPRGPAPAQPPKKTTRREEPPPVTSDEIFRRDT